MLTRKQKLESHFRYDVQEHAERLLKILASDELIKWGALTYPNMLLYLRDRIEEEIAAVTTPEDET